MKIKFVDSVAGANFSYRRNQVADLRVDIARGFIKAGQAVEHVELAVEKATVSAPETAAGRTGGRGRKRTLANLGGLIGS